ncbi:MAG: hypothetical protein JXM71_07900 [Spirochaetales bacterium]|nr:hypothetical protein [Spirochaetales bacterium]
MNFNKVLTFACVLALATSCTVLKAGSYATDVFMRESDPALAAQALPTMMKAAEALLLADPGDEKKSLTVASLYVMYANAFLESEAFLLPDDEFEAKRALSVRANALYRRAAGLLVPLVEAKAPGSISAAVVDDAKVAASMTRLGMKDVPLLYWTAAAVLGAFASDPLDFDNAALVGGAIALFERARELDPGWNSGSLHELAITVYGSLPADLGGNAAKAESAFKTAVATSGGSAPGPYVSFAQSVCTARGDEACFRSALETALSLETREEAALMDSLAKRKAERLLNDVALYF